MCGVRRVVRPAPSREAYDFRVDKKTTIVRRSVFYDFWTRNRFSRMPRRCRIKKFPFSFPFFVFWSLFSFFFGCLFFFSSPFLWLSPARCKTHDTMDTGAEGRQQALPAYTTHLPSHRPSSCPSRTSRRVESVRTGWQNLSHGALTYVDERSDALSTIALGFHATQRSNSYLQKGMPVRGVILGNLKAF